MRHHPGLGSAADEPVGSIPDMKRRQDRGSGLTPSMIDALKNRGYNQTQIGEMFGISFQRVSQIKYQTDRYTKSDRELAMEMFPFTVPKEPFQRASQDKRLRDHAEYAITGGTGMAQWKLNRLRRFYEKLRDDNTIVVFSTEIPPSDYNKHGGYAYANRTECDDDYLVRFNGDVDLTEEQKMMWRFPPVWPEYE